ncbi:MAG: peptidoglycan DD-metalloendopeptidase family protein [Bacteroidota bacterium]
MSKQNYAKLKKRLANWKKPFFTGSIILALAFGLYQFSALKQSPTKVNLADIGAFKVTQPNLKYGFALDTFFVSRDTIQNNQFLADILLQHKVDYLTIDELAKNSKEVFDVRNLRANKPSVILSRDSSQAADYFVYEPSVFGYVVYDLNHKTVKEVKHEINSEIEQASGVVATSLWNTMTDNGLSYELAAKMEDALAWSIDFHHIQKGDRFKLIFEQQYIDDQKVGIGAIQAAYYKNYDNEYYAIYFENEKHSGFYDLEARPMKKAFLKSPVKYSRISSRYNLRRFHPILKRTRPHYGTDYAAPRGTPIYAVADGVVTKASRTRGNGNYVKIKHDKVYQTQYLHMQGFAKGIRPGIHVKQGQVIGYVGSTGLATGPHVCFRFWKNGKQVKHLRQNLPPPDPMPKEDIPKFNDVRDVMKAQLDQIEFSEKTTEEEKVEEEKEREDQVVLNEKNQELVKADQ